MSFGKQKSKTSQQQSGTSTTTVDPWAKSQWESATGGILDATKTYTSKPFESYTKPMVAGLSPEQMRAREMASGSVGNWQGILGEAEDAAREGVGFDAGDVSRFYNPFESAVVDASGAYFDEELDRQINANKARATMSGSYGGGRHGVAEGELMRTSAMDKSKMMADLRYAGHRDAVDTGFREQQGRYQGAGILGELAGARQGFAANDIQMMEGLGATSREIEQAKLLSERAEFDRAAKDELDKLLLDLQTRQGILGSIPFTTSTSTTGQSSGTGSGTQFGVSWSAKNGIGG
jgi:hypothetical protein